MINCANRFALRKSVAAVYGALLALALMPQVHAAEGDTGKPSSSAGQEPGSLNYAEIVAQAVSADKASEAASQEPNAQDLTRPTKQVEIGIGYVGNDSAKFGEYNGRNKKGPYAIGNFDLRGGGAYDSNDASRWRFNGTDLGLETRNLQGEYGEQGKFRLNFGYDELLRNRSDTYQTPYNGAGSNVLTLPGNWIVPTVPLLGAGPNARGLNPAVANSNAIVGGVSTAPSAANLATSNALINADIPDFHEVELSTKRTKSDAGVSYSFDPQWGFDASIRHEHKDGVKPMGTVSRNSRSTGGASLGDISTIIPDLIDTDTDQFNASLNYKGDKSYAQATYYGSIFKNNVPSMSWQNWATGPTGSGTLNAISSTPSNQFHQLGLTGGYKFSSTTKLVVNGSYARSTQNDSFLTNDTTPVVPVSSLNALVVSKDLNAKFTARPVKDLNLAANFKYADRDNRTPVNTYQYADAQEAAVANALFPGVLAQNANANRAYSKKINQFNFDADYAVAKRQWLKAGYDFQKIDRTCNGSWIDCADAATTKENTLRAEWRANMREDLNGKVGYAYSQRRVSNYNENAFLALVPYANVVPAGQTISAYQAMLLSGLTGYGPVSDRNGGVFAGSGLTAAQAAFFFPNNNVLPNNLYANQNRISELPGMRRLFVADRNRDKLRTSVNWQANEQLSLQAGLDFNKDNFINSVYGLQDAKSWVLNLEGSYSVSDDLTASMFYSFEDQRSASAGNSYTANSTATSVNGFTAISGGCFATIALRNASNKVDPCNDWSTDMRDKVDTLGFALNKKNLMSGKLDLAASLIFTRARSDNTPTGGNYVNNPYAVTGAPAGTIAAFFIPAQALPTVTTDTTELRLNGRYTIDKSTSVRLLYSYARMKSADYAYASMQDGAIAGQFPTFEMAPNFTIHVVGVSYIRQF
jgi:MtrB/PioB family decaheme-associated outer membrane protein